MSRRVVSAIIFTLISVAILAAIAFYAYSWGLSQGALQNAQIVVPGAGEGQAPVYPYYVMPYHFGRWGWGWGGAFGFLQCLIPIFGIFLAAMLLRLLFGRPWRRGWGWGGPGRWDSEHGTPPMFAEWHRRAHAGEDTPPSSPPAQG
jgi:hypothetical protein